MKQIGAMLTLILASLALSACNARISSEIYLADIDELSGGESMTTEVLIGLPVSGEDDCAEKRRRYGGVFRKSTGFKSMEYVSCDGDFADYSLEVPLRMADPNTSPMQDAFDIIRHDESELGYHELYIRSKPTALCNLNKLIREEFYQSLDLTEVSPRIYIENDLREPQTLILNHVFVNGAPVIEPTEFVLDRRDSVDVSLSDVTSAWVFDKSCNISLRAALVAVWATD